MPQRTFRLACWRSGYPRPNPPSRGKSMCRVAERRIIAMVPEQEIVTKKKQQVEGAEKTRPGRYFVPDVDICEYDDMLRLWADMPGTTEKDVEVILKDNMLTIAGTVDASIYDQLAPLYA